MLGDSLSAVSNNLAANRYKSCIYLLSEGEHVMHILGTAHVDEASLTPSAEVRSDGRIIYPAECPQLE